METTFSKPTDTTIAYEREFNASVDRVWAAYTEPELVRQWLGYGEFITCEMDIRDGGSYLWVWRLDGGQELSIRGEVIEATPPTRLVADEYMDGVDSPTRSAIEFIERDGTTVMLGTMEFASAEIRDQAYATGMAEGMDWSFNRMADLLR
nr:SRPBCC domain-containing protein [Pseudoclavibacter sp. Marseille-Q3772]